MVNPNYSNDMLTSTMEKYLSKKPIDVIFNDLPLFEFLNAKKQVKEKVVGGRKLTINLMYAKNTTVRSYSGYDTLDISPQEGFTTAEFDWKMYDGSISISGEDEMKNAGEAQIFDLLEAKWEQLKMSFKDELNEASYSDGTGNNGKDVVGLALMADSAGNYGGIARASNSWWAAQETAVAGPLQIEGQYGMKRMANDCSLGHKTGQPDFLLTTQDIFEFYESLMGPQLRYSVSGEANTVFSTDGLKFRKAMLTWDHAAPAGTMFFLNSNHVQFVVREGRDFKMTPFQTPIDQDARVAHVRWMGNLVANNCRRLGKLTGITT